MSADTITTINSIDGVFGIVNTEFLHLPYQNIEAIAEAPFHADTIKYSQAQPGRPSSAAMVQAFQNNKAKTIFNNKNSVLIM